MHIFYTISAEVEKFVRHSCISGPIHFAIQILLIQEIIQTKKKETIDLAVFKNKFKTVKLLPGVARGQTDKLYLKEAEDLIKIVICV